MLKIENLSEIRDGDIVIGENGIHNSIIATLLKDIDYIKLSTGLNAMFNVSLFQFRKKDILIKLFKIIMKGFVLYIKSISTFII